MASYDDKWRWWGSRSCGKGRIDVTFMGRSPVRIQPEMVNAVAALERAFIDNGYQMPIGVTGSYSCRTIGGSDKMSLHSIPIAIDVDYSNNPYLRGDPVERGYGTDPRFLITETQVDAVEAIVNEDGVPIWKWLGWSLGDTMHFEIDVPPDKVEPVDPGPEPSCVPSWYDYDVYWKPYIDAVWLGGAPDECKTLTHWELSVILKKLGLT